jgi:CubicO group peptidase (beta-lactamase class C family)
VATFEARGFGGQFIVVVPKLDMVIVVTGHVTGGSENLIDSLINKYVIPAFF